MYIYIFLFIYIYIQIYVYLNGCGCISRLFFLELLKKLGSQAVEIESLSCWNWLWRIWG